MTNARSILPCVASLLVAAGGWAQVPSGPMPAGHPDMLTQLEAGPKGMLAIRAVQSTKDGAPVGGDAVEVILFHREMPLKTIRGTLDDQGMLLLGDIPIGVSVSPLVRVHHAGVQYQDAAPEMSAENTNAKVDIKVYEVTDEKPQWNVALRHMVVEKRTDGYVVSEMMVVDNKGDKTWMGDPPDLLKRRNTVPLPLPVGASDVELVQGFHGWCCSAMKDSALQVQMPFMPGKMTYKFAYRVTPKDGVLDLRVTMPVETARASFFVPDDGTKVEASGVAESGSDTSGAQRLTMFSADNVGASQMVGVVLRTPVQAAAPAPAPAKKGTSPTVLVVGGAAALVAVALAWKVMAGRGK
ncbi:MAG TPA: hypothetical protein VHN77_05850 [Phycisphaerales bacterium]|nr:hypothetical protein [Phycisphaerales bacterium]